MTERSPRMGIGVLQPPTWADRIKWAVDAWVRWDGLPDSARMDRVLKESGVRDLVVENRELREALERIAHMDDPSADRNDDLIYGAQATRIARAALEARRTRTGDGGAG